MPRARVAAVEPYVSRLRADLAGIRDRFLDVVNASGIVDTDPNRGAPGEVMLVGFPLWGWVASTPELTRQRMTVLGQYRAWRERLGLLFPHPTREVSSTLTDADALIQSWLERTKHSHDVPASIPAAHEHAAGVFATFDELLDLAPPGDDTLRLVPDTNALLANPDLASYATLVDATRYEVVLLPTVISELDELKDRGRTPELRDKAQAVVRRIKGLRDKGRLTAGVPLTKTMTVRTEHRDLDPTSVLGWLTRDSADDAILAGALTLQSAHPHSVVLLVTRDMNLQNKSEMGGLPYVEPPPDPALGRARLTAEVGYRASAEHPTGLVPEARLTNQGPADAADVEYQIASTDGAPIKVTAGPWTLGPIAAGGSVAQDIVLLSGGSDALVTATWTDASGPRQQTWTVPFPARPAAPPTLVRRPRR